MRFGTGEAKWTVRMTPRNDDVFDEVRESGRRMASARGPVLPQAEREVSGLDG